MANIPIQSDDFQDGENNQDLNQSSNQLSQTDDSQFGLVDSTKNIPVSSDDASTGNSGFADAVASSSDNQSTESNQSPVQPAETAPVNPDPVTDSSRQEINDSLAASNTQMPQEQAEAKAKMEEATKQANDALGDMFNVLGDESEAEDLEKSSSENTDQSAQESSPQANNSMPNSAPETQEKEDDPAGEADQAL